jgi:hypothetical protein
MSMRWKNLNDISSRFDFNLSSDNLNVLCFASLAGIGLGLTATFDLHLSLHIVGLLLACLLAVVSWASYFRDRRPKIGFLAFAFLFLTVHQLLELSESLGSVYVNFPVPFLGIEVIHLVSLGTVVFLAAGILKK